MAAALALPYDPSIARLRDDMARVCEGFGATVIGKSAPRLPNTLCLGLPGVRAETQVIALDLAGIAVSAGAACSSGKVAQSHVLLAMGLGELAGQAIRVSLPWNTEPEAVSVFTAAYRAMRDNALRGAAPLISERRNFA
jgi:cysteine desulfurase